MDINCIIELHQLQSSLDYLQKTRNGCNINVDSNGRYYNTCTDSFVKLLNSQILATQANISALKLKCAAVGAQMNSSNNIIATNNRVQAAAQAPTSNCRITFVGGQTQDGVWSTSLGRCVYPDATYKLKQQIAVANPVPVSPVQSAMNSINVMMTPTAQLQAPVAAPNTNCIYTSPDGVTISGFWSASQQRCIYPIPSSK